jgi:hypothetical protein
MAFTENIRGFFLTKSYHILVSCKKKQQQQKTKNKKQTNKQTNKTTNNTTKRKLKFKR